MIKARALAGVNRNTEIMGYAADVTGFFLYDSCDRNTDLMLDFAYHSWLKPSLFFSFPFFLFLFFFFPPFIFLLYWIILLEFKNWTSFSGIPDKPELPAQHLVIKLKNKGNEKHISQYLFPAGLRIVQCPS